MARFIPMGDAAEDAARRAKAIQLKSSGLTWQQIADQMSEEYHGNKGSAWKDVRVALDQSRREIDASLEHLIQIEDARYDDLRRRAYSIMSRPHRLYHAGKLVRDADGNAVLDDEPALKAMDRLLAIARQYARLHGLDANEKLEIAFAQRADLESTIVVEAILAGFDAADLPPALRMKALEAAQRRLSAVDGEVVAETEEPG